VDGQANAAWRAKPLNEALTELFDRRGVAFRVVDRQIVLYTTREKPQQRTSPRRHTISGYMKDLQTTENLIGATVLNKPDMAGTSTNRSGFYSLTLPVGDVELVYSYVGYGAQTLRFRLEGDTVLNVNLERSSQLPEVIVTADEAKANVTAPQMGRISISDKLILNRPVMFGEPDIVKTLQTMPGVSPGVEGFTGFYVRGGEDDQNLFLYQGLPLYHVSHLGGIFSSFNVSTVKGLEFFKSSFPARYGGRVSSITDIKMNEPDFEKYTGQFTLGLSGNLYVTGPLAKEKTAFSLGLRRSWIDVVSIPALAIFNLTQKNKGEKDIAQYAFTDLNVRLDHRFNDRAKVYIVGYYGHDNLKIGKRLFENKEGQQQAIDAGEEPDRFFDEDVNKLSWGNRGVLGAFDLRLNQGFFNVSAYYSNYSSSYKQEKEFQSNLKDPSTYGYNRSHTENAIEDIGFKASWLGDFGGIYVLEGGAGFIHHDYLPEGLLSESGEWEESFSDSNESPHVFANEGYVYVDNTLNITDRVALQVGLRGVSYHVHSQSYNKLEPRASMRIGLSPDYSVKAGYARMYQFAQQISNNYINLPTDLWQPVTAGFEPLQSDQYSLGIYGNLPHSLFFSVEGWYKDMRHLLEYREGISSLNPNVDWEEKLTDGEGWSYGVDASVSKTYGRVTGSVGYGLMWNWRQFDLLNQGKTFPAKFDNRHKININANYSLTEKIELNAAWTYMTGNRLTLSLYNYDIPGQQFPDAPSQVYAIPEDYTGLDYFSERNNIRLPAYHRLDIGVNIHKELKKGRKGIWNISLYNAYCRMNPVTVRKDDVNNLIGLIDRQQWKRAFKTFSFIPIIPFVSYTYIF
ncbi:MAG: TonB-dependent receptor, partial [Tannerella sp.]|nr:TonB-dependent receptor [Tannerella sp.]